MNKKIISVTLALSIILTTNSKTFAEPALDSQLQDSQNRYNQSQSALNTAQKKAKDAETKIEMLDNQIQQGMEEINGIKNKINKKEQYIKTAEQGINIAEENIRSKQYIYNKRIRAIYMTGNTGYLSMLLSANGIDDFFSKAEAIKKITEYNNNVISELSEGRQNIQKKKDKLAVDKNTLVVLKSDSEKRLKNLNIQKEKEIPLLTEAKSEVDSAVALNASFKAQIDTIKQKAAALKAAEAKAAQENTNNNVTINRGGSLAVSNYSSDTIIAYAATFLGTPYVWGGGSPNPGFDCSGFTQYVYRHFGVSLGRTTYDQIKDGVEVSKGQLQAGDLVFFGTLDDPHHMGMYIGNGMYIHAPHTGDVIKISPLGRSDYLTARRVKY